MKTFIIFQTPFLKRPLDSQTTLEIRPIKISWKTREMHPCMQHLYESIQTPKCTWMAIHLKKCHHFLSPQTITSKKQEQLNMFFHYSLFFQHHPFCSWSFLLGLKDTSGLVWASLVECNTLRSPGGNRFLTSNCCRKWFLLACNYPFIKGNCGH